jgi:predicted acylesterase/phospholipase RssA
MKLVHKVTAISLLAALIASAQSPQVETTVAVNGKVVSVKYSAPAVRGRQIFGDGGLLSRDPTYPVWRAGANNATAFHTNGDMTLGTLTVPKGDYTLYVSVKDPNAWELILSKETGQWGLSYNAKMDLGRTKMAMSKPPALVEQLKYTLTPAKLELSWENHTASVPITMK